MKRLLKSRLLLMLLCVVIGMAPLIALINTAESTKHMLKKDLQKDELNVRIALDGSSAAYEDFIKVQEQMPEVREITPIALNSTVLSSYKGKSMVNLKAVGSEFPKYAALKIEKGKFISKGQLENHAKIIVIDDLTADELFGTTDIIGRSLAFDVDGVSMEAIVVGICKRLDVSEAQLSGGQGTAYIPITMLEDNLLEYSLHSTILQINGLSLENTRAKLVYFFDAQGIPLKSEDITQVNQIEIMKYFLSQYEHLFIVMGILWLLVALLGLISMQLLEVEGNKKYYGLLLFFGSPKKVIRNLVFDNTFQSGVACSVVSIVLGVAISFLVCLMLNIPLYISIHSITIGVALPFALCMTAAVYPAFRASRTDVNRTIWQLE